MEKKNVVAPHGAKRCAGSGYPAVCPAKYSLNKERVADIPAVHPALKYRVVPEKPLPELVLQFSSVLDAVRPYTMPREAN